jgi:hypothetical protein
MKSKNIVLAVLSLFALTLASCAGQNRGYCGPMSRYPVPQRYAAPCPPSGYAPQGYAQNGGMVQTGGQWHTTYGTPQQHTVQGPTRTSDGRLLGGKVDDILIQRNTRTGEVREVVAQTRELDAPGLVADMEKTGTPAFPSTIHLGPNGWVFPKDQKSPIVRPARNDDTVLPPR